MWPSLRYLRPRPGRLICRRFQSPQRLQVEAINTQHIEGRSRTTDAQRKRRGLCTGKSNCTPRPSRDRGRWPGKRRGKLRRLLEPGNSSQLAFTPTHHSRQLTCYEPKAGSRQPQRQQHPFWRARRCKRCTRDSPRSLQRRNGQS